MIFAKVKFFVADIHVPLLSVNTGENKYTSILE